MLDADLARLYGVTTKSMNRAVKRHRDRFPEDFMLQLTADEAASLRCQSGTSKTQGGRRYLPYVFTEQGVAMLSGVLTSRRAVAVNVAIMRAFVAMRKVLMAHADLAKRLALLESEMAGQAAAFGHHKAETIRALKVVFETRKELATQASRPEPKREPIGFKVT